MAVTSKRPARTHNCPETLRSWARLPAGLHVLPASFLLLAAFMKWKQLPVIGRMGNDFLHNRWIAAAQILLETAPAIWLLSSLASWWSRRVTLGLFVIFAAVAAYRGIAGETSCGCFGDFELNPFLTLALDLSVIALLLASLTSKSRPLATDNTERTEPRSSSVYSVYSVVIKSSAVVAMLAVIALTLWRMPSASATNDPTTGIIRSGNLLILEPAHWPGQSLPIASYLDHQPAPGRSIAIIYSNDCDNCREIVPKARDTVIRSGVNCLFIEMPPYAPPGEELVHPSGPIILARLTDQHEWFASTPVVVELQDGIVQRAAEGKDAENVDKWFGATQDNPQAKE